VVCWLGPACTRHPLPLFDTEVAVSRAVVALPTEEVLCKSESSPSCSWLAVVCFWELY